MGKVRSQRSSLVYRTPFSRESTPSSSDLEDWDAETVMDSSSRPTSWAIPRTGSPFLNPPTLDDILSNTAPHPWTLAAFMAYLSQNHCLETLEFIMDAARYRATHMQMTQGHTYLGVDHICELWEKIIRAYILPGAPREVNIPAPVRDRLLGLRYTSSTPPDPVELDEATGIVRELMTDSVLVPFLESVVPVTVEAQFEEEMKARHERARLRIPKDVGTSEDSAQSPIATILPLFGKGRVVSRSNSGSSDSHDVEMTDDSSSPTSTPTSEPMTPPTTPPTSDFSFNASPKALQRALSGTSWKKVGAKLGLGRRNYCASELMEHQPTDGLDIWEEPHPGDRMLVSTGSLIGPSTYSHILNGAGDIASSVAAKAGMPHITTCLVKRNLRLRQHAALKTLRIPPRISEGPNFRRDSMFSPHSDQLMFSTTMAPIQFLPGPDTLQPLEVDTDTETTASTDVGTDSDGAWPEIPKASRACPLSDLSNYLGISRCDTDANADIMMGQPDHVPLARETSCDMDSYGWEGEYDRRLDCGRPSSGRGCPRRGYH
ncbi:putative regulator of g-protein signaling [Rosellinia necatrix]|uniref:Putative regulator of g-protein signaling n=1 Tax=Rosellinia necatrix TaxID=77044 RepID=A0A1W2TUB9_ROSNE|nr:putative regulator of g-protein signaling [Rosellinia necatrix]